MSIGPVRAAAIRSAVVAATAVLPFLDSLSNPRLWDDRYIFESRLAPGAIRTLSQVWREPYWGSAMADVFRPFGLSAIVLEHRLFGNDVTPYHQASLVLHAGVSLLVMAVIGRLTSARIGWICALLFAAHPVHAEAVNMVYGQLELLAALFVLLAIGLDRSARGARIRPILLAASLGCALLAICSKESAMMLPLLIVLVRTLFPDRAGGDAAMNEERPPSIGKRLLGTPGLGGLAGDALFLAPVLVYLVLRYRALGHLIPHGGETFLTGYSPAGRVKTVLVSLGEAIRLCVWPTGQTVYYGHLRDAVFGTPLVQTAWIVAGVLACAALWKALGATRLLFGAGWFLLALLPVMNIVPSGVLAAERTLYLPVLGVTFLGAALADAIAARGAAARVAAWTCVAALVAAGAVASNAVVRTWHSEESLWRATVSSHPRSGLANVLLGNAILRRWELMGVVDPSPDELAEAGTAFDHALEITPALTQALTGGGYVAMLRGEYRKAQRMLEQAVDMAPADERLRALLDECRRRSAAAEGGSPRGSRPQ